MSTNSDHTIRPDAKGRVALGAFAKGVSSFRIHQEKDGRLILEPFTEIPAREAWLYKNKEALASVLTGIAQAKAGKLKSLGDFSKYLED